MKKTVIYSLLAIFSILYGQAQNKAKLDSLKQVLAKLPPEGRSFASDTMRVKVLCEMGQEYMSSDTAITFLKEALTIAEKVRWKNGKAIALNLYARRTKKQGNFILANELAYKALASAEEAKNKSEIGFAYRNLADAQSSTKKYKESIAFYNKAILNYKQANNKSGVLTCMNNIGLVYNHQNDFLNAQKAFFAALKFNKTDKVPYYDALLYNNLAMNYEDGKQYEMALLYVNKAIELYKKLGPKHNEDLATSYTEIASIYHKLKKYKLAIEYVNLSVEIDKGSYDVNLNYADNLLYQIYTEMSNYEKAFFYYKRMAERKDSTNNITLNQQLNANRIEYDNDKLLLEAEKNQFMQRLMAIGLVFFLFFIGFIWRNNNILQRKNSQIEEQKIRLVEVNNEIEDLNKNLEQKVEKRTSELQKAYDEIKEAMLKGQTLERKRVATELHDNLGSMLSGLRFRFQALNSDNLTDKEKKIYASIMSLMGDAYSEVRLISHNLLPAELESKGLIGALEKLVADINLHEKLQIHLQVDDPAIKIEKKVQLELYSICLELVNNIQKHAEATAASISFSHQNSHICLEIADNGKGIEADSLLKGMGMKNIQNRINIISGDWEIISQPNKGSTFTIKIPTTD
ncbi:MAG: sensor histidine kinase [Spirosomataceae bacterium]